MNKTIKKFVEEKQARLNAVLGNEITIEYFASELFKMIGEEYRIHNGWSARDIRALEDKSETCICGGTIAEVKNDAEMLQITLNDDKYPSERFTHSSIQKVTQRENNFYVIYKDDSYYRIVVGA